MASFNFFATEEDVVDIMKSILSLGLELAVKDHFLSKPELTFYRDCSRELVQGMIGRHGLWIRGPFSKWREVFVGDDNTGYGAVEMSGGPLLMMLVPTNVVKEDGRLELRQGFLTRRAQYVNPDNGAVEDASLELREWYLRIVATMKKSMRRSDVGAGAMWLGKRAFSLVAEGRAVVYVHEVKRR